MYMSIEDNIEHVKKPVFVGIMATIYFLYFCLYIGITFINPNYVQLLSKFIRLFVCMFLIIRFHPFKRSHVLRDFDEQLIFTSAIFLLTDLGITQYITNYVKRRVTWSNTLYKII
jgi:hypothetical protein